MKQIYPGYDVLNKRHTPSWDEPSRQVVDARLAVPREPRFFGQDEWQTVQALAARMLPQPDDRPPIPLAALLDHKLLENRGDGYRDARLPPLRQAWRQGLAALEAEARQRHGKGFASLSGAEQDALIGAMQNDELEHPAWGEMPAAAFFSHRLIHDLSALYYAHPTAWSEIGFGGPANPRGYVRLGPDSADPWEAQEGRPGDESRTERRNRHVR